MIEQTGWRTACTAMGILVLVVLAPINLLLRKRPEDIGLLPDGDAAPTATSAKPVSNIVDPVWAGTDWTLRRALRTARFWWIALGYFCGLYIWYAVQVHQTKYLLDIGFSAERRGLGAGRGQPARHSRPDLARASLRPDRARMDLGDELPRLCDLLRGADRAEIRAGVAAGLSDDLGAGRARLRPDLDHGRGGARDIPGQAIRQHFRHHHAGGAGGRRRGPLGRPAFCTTSPASYTIAFAIGIAVSVLSAIAIWQASPRKIRAVAGQMHKVQGGAG